MAAGILIAGSLTRAACTLSRALGGTGTEGRNLTRPSNSRDGISVGIG